MTFTMPVESQVSRDSVTSNIKKLYNILDSVLINLSPKNSAFVLFLFA